MTNFDIIGYIENLNLQYSKHQVTNLPERLLSDTWKVQSDKKRKNNLLHKVLLPNRVHILKMVCFEHQQLQDETIE